MNVDYLLSDNHDLTDYCVNVVLPQTTLLQVMQKKDANVHNEVYVYIALDTQGKLWLVQDLSVAYRCFCKCICCAKQHISYISWNHHTCIPLFTFQFLYTYSNQWFGPADEKQLVVVVYVTLKLHLYSFKVAYHLVLQY